MLRRMSSLQMLTPHHCCPTHSTLSRMKHNPNFKTQSHPTTNTLLGVIFMKQIKQVFGVVAGELNFQTLE